MVSEVTFKKNKKKSAASGGWDGGVVFTAAQLGGRHFLSISTRGGRDVLELGGGGKSRHAVGCKTEQLVNQLPSASKENSVWFGLQPRHFDVVRHIHSTLGWHRLRSAIEFPFDFQQNGVQKKLNQWPGKALEPLSSMEINSLKDHILLVGVQPFSL